MRTLELYAHRAPCRGHRYGKVPRVSQARSYEQVVILEAASRGLRVDLVLHPVTPGSHKRLITKFLGLHGDRELSLAVPWTPKDVKVFVPIGWHLGMAFELSGLWIQARTEVVGHCQFRRPDARRVDALIVERPDRITSVRRRDYFDFLLVPAFCLVLFSLFMSVRLRRRIV